MPRPAQQQTVLSIAGQASSDRRDLMRVRAIDALDEMAGRLVVALQLLTDGPADTEGWRKHIALGVVQSCIDLARSVSDEDAALDAQ